MCGDEPQVEAACELRHHAVPGASCVHDLLYVFSNCTSRPAAHKLLQLRSSGQVPDSLTQAERLAVDIYLSMPGDFSQHMFGTLGMRLLDASAQLPTPFLLSM